MSSTAHISKHSSLYMHLAIQMTNAAPIVAQYTLCSKPTMAMVGHQINHRVTLIPRKCFLSNF